MELFTQLFGDLLAFVYHCFDRIVIYGYLSGLSRPEQVVHFFRQVVGVPVVSKEVLSQRTDDYQAWVGDGVDAPRRHLCAKVTVSNCHRRRRPWSRLLRSVWTLRSTCSSCMERMLPGMCCSASASLA
jgi:hypothetical protein